MNSQDPRAGDNYLEEEGLPQTEDRSPDEEFPVPGDSAQGAADYGTTAQEQLEGEPLTDRLARESPDESQAARTDAPEGRLVDPEPEVDQIDSTPELIATDEESDQGPLSAEEDAMHLESG